MRRIVHVDMDAFFAAVELQRHPELAGKPLVIGGRGDPTERGVVSTASYEARKFGIRSGMPLRTAYRLCPHAVFMPVDFEEYERVSARIKAILREMTPIVEDAGIDEAFLDISESREPSEAVAREIKDRIKQATGLTCSVGIAPNKLLAKIASEMQKPDGLTIISEQEIPPRIWPLPVGKLLWVGPKTEKRLKEIGVESIGDLAAVPLEELAARFGPAHGRYLYEAARGIDQSPLVTHWEPKSSGHETTFRQDVADRQVIEKAIAELARETTENLRQEGYKGGRVTLKVRFSDFETHTRQKTLEAATDSLETISEAAFDCLGRVELRKPVRLLGIRVGNLQKSAAGGDA